MYTQRVKVLMAGVMVGVGAAGMAFGNMTAEKDVLTNVLSEHHQSADFNCDNMKELIDSGTANNDEMTYYEKNCN
jgi:hypothetical protein